MCGGVAVFPLFTGLPLFPGNSSDYVLASEAMANGDADRPGGVRGW